LIIAGSISFPDLDDDLSCQEKPEEPPNTMNDRYFHPTVNSLLATGHFAQHPPTRHGVGKAG
jgi:hypothetical protein